MRELADRAVPASRIVEIGRRDASGRSHRNPDRIQVQPEREAAEDRELRARIVAVEIRRRVGLGVALRARVGKRRVHRAAGGVDLRQDGVGRAVQNRLDAGDAIAGEAFGDGADDRHRAADGCLEPQLTPLPRC